jgi:hypothetical protein
MSQNYDSIKILINLKEKNSKYERSCRMWLRGFENIWELFQGIERPFGL